MKYFAYGSNMSGEVIGVVCPNYQTVGLARLVNYRLAFSRRSIKTGTGVADVIPALGFVVYGIVYEIDEEGLFRLDRKEGYGFAYTRTAIHVDIDDETHEAITYIVMKKEDHEIAPSDEYLAKLLDGVGNFEFPRRYRHYIESLLEEEKGQFRKGFIIKPTDDRTDAHGDNIIRISSAHSASYKKNKYCFVRFQKRVCAAVIQYDENLAPGICESDQNVRHALNILGRDTYGTFIDIIPSDEPVPRISLIRPRKLYLPLHRPAAHDSEKRICVLHKNTIPLLGIEIGDYLRIKTVIVGDDGELQLSQISRRVFTGSVDQIMRGQDDIPYPCSSEFYLDLDGRNELGITKNKNYDAVILSADVPKLFMRRMLYYGATLFLGFLALPPLFEQIAAALSMSRTAGIAGGLVLALFVTIILTAFDLRARVQY